MAQPPATTTGAAGTWEEDPTGASLLLATGRRRHDLLVVAEPALLTDLDEAWGRPASKVRLSLLPGVSAPGGTGQEDALWSYDRAGLGVLVARGRTAAFEGKPMRRTTSLARIAAGAGVQAALFVTRATSVGTARPGDFLAVADHLALGTGPLFAAAGMVEAAWDEDCAARLAEVDGVRGAGVVALTAGPLRPTRAEAAFFAQAGADAVVTDSVAEAMVLAARGARVAGLAYVDRLAPGADEGARRRAGRRAAPEVPQRRRHATHVVRAAVESMVTRLSA